MTQIQYDAQFWQEFHEWTNLQRPLSIRMAEDAEAARDLFKGPDSTVSTCPCEFHTSLIAVQPHVDELTIRIESRPENYYPHTYIRYLLRCLGVDDLDPFDQDFMGKIVITYWIQQQKVFIHTELDADIRKFIATVRRDDRALSTLREAAAVAADQCALKT